jgi:hypothetical protein
MPEDQYCALVMNYSHGLLLRALAGDQEAAKLINQFPFQVDGGLAELVQAHQDTYKEAEWLGCVGVR